MENRIYPETHRDRSSRPEPYRAQELHRCRLKRCAALKELYDRNTAFLRDSFLKLAEGGEDHARFRAFYPEVGVSTTSYAQVDTRVCLRPRAVARPLRDDDHPAGSVRKLPASTSSG